MGAGDWNPAAVVAVKRRMAELQLTQKELATQSGVHPGTLNGFLRGRSNLRPDTAGRLEQTMGMEQGIITLLAYSPVEPPPEPSPWEAPPPSYVAGSLRAVAHAIVDGADDDEIVRMWAELMDRAPDDSRFSSPSGSSSFDPERAQ